MDLAAVVAARWDENAGHRKGSLLVYLAGHETPFEWRPITADLAAGFIAAWEDWAAPAREAVPLPTAPVPLVADPDWLDWQL